MKRRDFLKTIGFGLGFLATRQVFFAPQAARAEEAEGCKIVVFGSDSLQIDYAQTLRDQGAPALSSLNQPICSLNGGLSATQPGWATIWSGTPSFLNRTWSNSRFGSMPTNVHIIEKIIDMYIRPKLYVAWITGKGPEIAGNTKDSPHYAVYESVVKTNHPGVYHGDIHRPNSEVYSLALSALQEAASYENYICFVHFIDPDLTGHQSQDYTKYMEAAREVDEYIWDLMQLLPEADIIYCSDHGFNFMELGDVENGHSFSPRGMLATNFPTLDVQYTEQSSIGRLIYKLAGGNPHLCFTGESTYSMYGVDLI
jgi:hypothetical protein